MLQCGPPTRTTTNPMNPHLLMKQREKTKKPQLPFQWTMHQWKALPTAMATMR